MRSITVTMWVTLDGVVQGLGRADEDTRGGFTHGGWGPRYDDEVMSRELVKAMTRPGGMLRYPWANRYPPWRPRTDSTGTSRSSRWSTYRRTVRPSTPSLPASSATVRTPERTVERRCYMSSTGRSANNSPMRANRVADTNQVEPSHRPGRTSC